MSKTEKITVNLDDRRYDILVGPSLVEAAGKEIAARLQNNSTIIITDSTVARHHLAALCTSLTGANIAHQVIELEPGENTKEFTGFESLSNRILDLKPERRTTLIALGGGVIGDITGFAASVILRGIDFVQIPTTLLAQVDSSVGGKTGINTRHGKNLVGSFYQPRLVLADTEVLDTLPRRELLAGYAEIVKYGLLGDPAFFAWLEANGEAIINGDHEARCYAIVKSCRAKAKIVADDERETGRRALLNLGHTFGHALEADTGFGERLLHGEAIAIGTIMAFDLSVQLGICPPEDAARVRQHFSTIGLPIGLDAVAGHGWAADALMSHMHQDKKVHDGQITFILVRGIGKAFIAHDVAMAELESLLENAIAA